MNNRKQANRRKRNPRQYVVQVVPPNPATGEEENRVLHLASNQSRKTK